jgi:surfactin synthase thioesterase subunit
VIGSSDDVSREEALSWRKITSGPFDLKIFPGNHFFIFEHADEFLAYLRQKIAECSVRFHACL